MYLKINMIILALLHHFIKNNKIPFFKQQNKDYIFWKKIKYLRSNNGRGCISIIINIIRNSIIK